MNALTLPLDIYSANQLGIILLELHQYSSRLSDAAVRAKVNHTKETPTDTISPYLLQIIKQAKVDPLDHAALEELQKELAKLRATAPSVHLTLAALPSKTIKRELTEWFRANIHPQLLLSFVTRSDIGGGIVIQAGSRVYDFSFRKQLLANKQRLAEIYDGVAKRES